MTSRFTSRTIPFLISAGRAKSTNWLERHRDEHERVLQQPLTYLAQSLARSVGPLAPDYHFPLKGLGRLKRPANRVAERGGGLYKDWITYAAARPRTSRFEHNPNLFFLINTEDLKDPVLVAGGLYMPSSRQTRALREAIARDAKPFEELFNDPHFKRCFNDGFSLEKSSSRPPRGFDPAHPKIEWLKLQAFFVWRAYSKREFYSAGFAKLVARDWTQILRLNRLLEHSLQFQPRQVEPRSASPGALSERIESLRERRPEMDF